MRPETRPQDGRLYRLRHNPRKPLDLTLEFRAADAPDRLPPIGTRMPWTFYPSGETTGGGYECMCVVVGVERNDDTVTVRLRSTPRRRRRTPYARTVDPSPGWVPTRRRASS